MSERLYSKDHEWILNHDESANIVKVGITNYAQDSLGDIVYVDLPSIGAMVNEGDEVAVIESAKAASDIYAPISGEIVAINENLENQADLINTKPYDEGWLFSIKFNNKDEVKELMNEAEYEDYIKGL